MIYSVYVIENSERKIYIGQTNKLEKRIIAHNENRGGYTKGKGPWKLIFKKNFNNRKDAVEFERLLKKQKGGSGLNKIIEAKINFSAPR